MGKEKRSRRKKFEVPTEAKEKVERMKSMRMFSHRPEQEIYQALEECNMDFIDAMLRLSNLEIKKDGEAGGGGGGEREGRGTEGASRACPNCPVQSKNVEWTPSPSFISLLEKEKGKNRAGPPAEQEEQIERVNEILKQCRGDPNLAAERLHANWLEFEERKIRRGKQEALRGNDSSTGHGFTHPYVEPSYYHLQLPLQHGYMDTCEYTDQNFGYDMTSPQQEVYRGGSSSWANADPSGWGSFPGSGSTPQPHQFLPNSSAPFDSSTTQLNSALHVEAQRQHRNDYCPVGMYYNFGAQNSQLDPGAASALPKQQQGGFPGWVPLASDGNNRHHAMPSAQHGGFPRWVPLPSDGNNQHHDMPSAQQGGFPRWVPLPSDGNNQHHDNEGGGSSRANACTPSWGSIQGTGRTCSQSPPIPPHSHAPFNISWTNHDSTLEAQDQYINDHPFLIFPGPASTPHGHFPGWVPLPTNGRNRQAGEGSSRQYAYHGWHHPGTHQQQSP